MATLTCQNCGSQWDSSKEEPMFYFRTESKKRWTSPAEAFSLGELLIHCPHCPIKRIDKAMYEGDDRRGDL